MGPSYFLGEITVTRTNMRDYLTMQVLGWRQLIRDMPEEELPATWQMFAQLEEELKRAAGHIKKRT
jgi:hypothetical protein